METEPKEEKTVINKVSWIVPWIAGWLFTLGYIDWTGIEIDTVWEGINFFLGTFLGWAFLLGVALSGK